MQSRSERTLASLENTLSDRAPAVSVVRCGSATLLHAARRILRTTRRRTEYAAWSTNPLPPQSEFRLRAALPQEARSGVREAVCSLLRDADVSREPRLADPSVRERFEPHRKAAHRQFG